MQISCLRSQLSEVPARPGRMLCVHLHNEVAKSRIDADAGHVSIVSEFLNFKNRQGRGEADGHRRLTPESRNGRG